jgi:DNA polymerase
MPELVLDFETYSEANLKVVGTFNYARHTSTEILCLSYGYLGQEPSIWLPGDPFPDQLKTAISRNQELHAHTSEFEREIWANVAVKKLGWPLVPNRLWRCTAAKAAHSNLPRSLSKACTHLEMGDAGKDKDGHRVMLQLCKPFASRKKANKGEMERKTPETHPELFDRLYDYCCQDVQAEQALSEKCFPLPDREVRAWQLDQRINIRGVPIDRALCEGAKLLKERVLEHAKKIVHDATNGVITSPTQVKAITKYFEDNGAKIFDLQKATVEWALEREQTPEVRAILYARRDTSDTSIAKFSTALDQVSPDDRVRNQYKFYGAGPGRWAGRGVQFQNLRKVETGYAPDDETLDAIRTANLDALRAMGDEPEPLRRVSNCLRSMVLAPSGRKFVSVDFSAIEARGVHWLARDFDMCDKFASGAKIYEEYAGMLYDMNPADVAKDSDERQAGKVVVLGSGYCMGPDKLCVQAKQKAGLDLDLEFCRSAIEIYRRENPMVVDLWNQLVRASMACMRSGRRTGNDLWSFRIEKDWLTMRLPSGRKLYYFKPYVQENGKYGPEIRYKGPIGDTPLTKPILVENLTQATARDIFLDSMFRLDRAGYYLVAHTHDSAAVEVPESDDSALEKISAIMLEVPDWAERFPIGIDAHVGDRWK